jgi:hypothetical protein
MPGSKIFIGPPSNKATATTVAAGAATLFWTIAAHTFWKNMSIADMTLYITTSTTILAAIAGFFVPESAAFTEHNSQRLASQAPTVSASPAVSASPSSSGSLEVQIQGIQELQGLIANRLGIPATPAISATVPSP